MDHQQAVVLVQGALAGDQVALTRLVDVLTPVIQARVARTLLARRSRTAAGRNVRQEVEDLTQETFLALFSKGAHVLRSWRPERGLSLENFVGLVTQRRVVSILRSRRQNPWQEVPSLMEDLGAVVSDSNLEEVTARREQLYLLLDRLREELSPQGWHLFDLLFIQELSLPEVRAASGLSAVAVYAWRSRLRRLARRRFAELSESTGPSRKISKDGKV